MHTNELPLQHLILKKLDGKTTFTDGFNGPIGKLLSKVNSMKRKSDFTPIPLVEPLPSIPPYVVVNMSIDSSVCYQFV